MKRLIERTMAAASLAVAAALAFTALLLNEEHEIEAGVCMVIAQFLTFSATILGVDYKFNSLKHGISNATWNQEQQSPEHPHK